jgi:hypothetical protein
VINVQKRPRIYVLEVFREQVRLVMMDHVEEVEVLHHLLLNVNRMQVFMIYQWT